MASVTYAHASSSVDACRKATGTATPRNAKASIPQTVALGNVPVNGPQSQLAKDQKGYSAPKHDDRAERTHEPPIDPHCYPQSGTTVALPGTVVSRSGNYS